MIFRTHNKESVQLDSIRDRICVHAGIKLESCNKTAENIFYSLRNNSHGFHFPDQSQDALIYVAVVIVFYAAIIFILVGTNIRRRSPLHHHHQKMKTRTQMMAILDKKNVTKIVLNKSRDKDDEQLKILL